MLDLPMQAGLKIFIAQARAHGYGAGVSAMIEHRPNGAKVIEYYSENGGWFYIDEYHGGEPYGGCEKVSYGGKVIWMMVYYGSVDPDVTNVEPVYDCLRSALRAVPKESSSMRGPDEYPFPEGGLFYHNEWCGDFRSFYGRETIYSTDQKTDGKQAYSARYAGGLVDQR